MKKPALTLLAALVGIALLAPQLTAKSYKTYQDVPVSELKWSLPEHQEFALSNGIAGLVVEDHEVPMVDFEIAFSAPPDPTALTGLSEMTTWALRNGGSTNISADSLNDLLEFKAAYLWVSAGDEMLWLSGSCFKDDLPLLLSLGRELIDHPAYPDEKIELKRSTMLEQIRRRYDRPYGIARREFYRLIYPDHPWGRETGNAGVKAISRDDLLNYHRSVFQPVGAVIGFSGDVTADDVNELAGQYFGTLKPTGGAITTLPPLNPPAANGVYYAYKDFNQAFVAMGHRAIRYDDPRRPAAEIMNYILGEGSFQSRLTKRVRIDEGLAYSVWSSFSEPVPAEGTFLASAATRLDQAGRTVAIMRETIDKFRQEGPTAEEFDMAIKAYVNSYVWKYESSDEILSRLVYLKWRGLPLDTPQQDLAAYQHLTIDDVRRAAAELLHPDNLIIVVVGDRAKMDRPLEDFGTVTELELGGE
jgi:predicted Zn-dependent peptidase